MEQSICVFGDSIVQGFYDIENGGWVERLKTHLFEKSINSDNHYDVFNLGILGDTSNELLARIPSEASFRNPDIIIISIGVNDSVLGVSLEEFEDNVKDIIEESRDNAETVLVLGCNRVDEKLTNPVSWEDIFYKNDEIKKYDDKLNLCSLSEHVDYLSMFDLLDDSDFIDGIHPNSNGHKKIFEKVKQYLEEKKLI